MSATPPQPPEPLQPVDVTEQPRSARSRALDVALLVGGIAVVLAALILTPGGVLDKANHVGYAVCHQISVRSFFFADQQLPLCARCSGQYLGAIAAVGLMFVLGRGKAGALPSPGIVLALLGFLALWAFDGLNSYLTFFPGLPHLYEPRNALRVTTGALQGVALVALVWPFFGSGLWREPAAKRSIRSWREVALLLLLVAIIVALTTSEFNALLYPLALLSVGGTLMMLTIVNTMLLTILLRRANKLNGWLDALPLLVGGLALAVVQVAIINIIRAWLTSTMGLPF